MLRSYSEVAANFAPRRVRSVAMKRCRESPVSCRCTKCAQLDSNKLNGLCADKSTVRSPTLKTMLVMHEIVRIMFRAILPVRNKKNGRRVAKSTPDIGKTIGGGGVGKTVR